MTAIRIVRAKEYKSSLREIKIEIDGIEIGGVNNGEEKSFEVEPGPHKIQATLDKICTSNLIKVMLGENETIQLRLSHKSGLALINLMFHRDNYLKLEKK